MLVVTAANTPCCRAHSLPGYPVRSWRCSHRDILYCSVNCVNSPNPSNVGNHYKPGWFFFCCVLLWIVQVCLLKPDPSLWPWLGVSEGCDMAKPTRGEHPLFSPPLVSIHCAGAHLALQKTCWAAKLAENIFHFNSTVSPWCIFPNEYNCSMCRCQSENTNSA